MNIPRNVEVLIKKAAVDPELKALLLDKRAEAAKAVGLELDAVESAMLAACPLEQLERIIALTKAQPRGGNALLGTAVTVAVLATGAALFLPSLGSRPDWPPTSTNPEANEVGEDRTGTTTTSTTQPPDTQRARPDRPAEAR